MSIIDNISFPLDEPIIKKRNKLNKEQKMKFNQRELKKQEKNNELNRYCRLMDYCLEVGFSYDEAEKYARSLLRR